MKKMQNKGFTLVELIVVITILAILGTIAFISLQGYGAEAKNSKVTSDLRNLVSAIETKRTRDSGVRLSDLITADTTANELTAGTVGSGTTLASLSTADTYEVGAIDFTALGQNGSDFTDPNADNAQYVYAFVSGTNASSDPFGGYQLAGQLIDNEVDKVRVNGNYVESIATDSVGLIAAAGATTAALDDGALATLR